MQFRKKFDEIFFIPLLIYEKQNLIGRALFERTGIHACAGKRGGI